MPVLEQPFPSVAVSVYCVLEVGEAVGFEAVALDKVAAGAHK